jgi:hypothetical protein
MPVFHARTIKTGGWDMLLQHKVDEKRVCSRKELERVAPRHVAEEVGEGNGGAGVIPPIEPVDLFGVVEQGCTDCRRVVRGCAPRRPRLMH